MPNLAMFFGGLLTALGAVAFFQLGEGDTKNLTALSPAFVGLPIALAGLLSALRADWRKHAMHLAAMFALLGVVGGIVPAAMSSFDVSKNPVVVGLCMTGLSAVFLGLCVKSFVEARKARERREAVA